MAKYKSIEVIANGDKEIKAKIIFDDNSVKEFHGKDTIREQIILFAVQEGIHPNDLLNDSSKYKESLVEESKELIRVSHSTSEEKTPISPLEPKTTSSVSSIESSTKEYSKGSVGPDLKAKRKKGIKITSFFLAVIVALVGNSHLKRSNNYTAVSDGLEVIQGYTTKDLTLEEFMSNLDYYSMLTHENLHSISEFLSGGTLAGTPIDIRMQDNFTPGTINYAIIEHFNNLRNNVIKAAYDHRSVAIVNNAVNEFMRSYLKFFYMGDVIRFNDGMNATFNNIDPMTQKMILDMATPLIGLLEDSFVVSSGNLVIDREKAYELLMISNNDIMQKLNSGRSI